ncbi:MAG: hypothetical protein FJ098_16955 [Deltaproteobacteria bacterium]|nr:hypothetical protein [Deltaproteobacteria bacterium]
MPIHLYLHLEPGTCPEPFEELARLRDPPLAACPRCGRPVRKMPAAFSHAPDVLAASNLKEKGFQRWRRRDRGAWEKE